ncbi:hypothetical protein COE51_03025 [Bacillus pseudomycoides]|nr:hypothetical protein COE51_03025 [Bacillus pseudomycoides]
MLPSEIKRITAPTNTVWVLGRILVKSDEDISRVRQLQKKFIFTTLSGSSPLLSS